jgi:proteasome alpha subunit
VQEEHDFIVMGGNSEPIAAVIKDRHQADADRDTAVRLAVEALAAPGEGGEARTIAPETLEAAVLDRTRPRRAFKRLTAERLASILGD